MTTSLHEQVLYDYWFFQAALGNVSYSSKDLFFNTARVYGLSAQESEELYSATQSREIEEIRSDADFKQYQRIVEYFTVTGKRVDYPSRLKEMITLKGRAYADAKKHSMIIDGKDAVLLVKNHLLQQSDAGNVYAIRTLGFLTLTGILFEKDEEAGCRRLKDAADWNDVFSLLALIACGLGDREENVSRLCTVYGDAADKEFIEKLSGKKREDIECCERAKLLNDLFALGTCNKDKYSSIYAKTVFADSICLQDVKNIVYSESAAAVAMIAQLPLALKKLDLPRIGKSLKDNGKLRARSAEADRICQALRKSEFCSAEGKTVCISSNSSFARALYEEAFSACEGVMVTKVNVGELKSEDFDKTFGNFFLKSLGDGRQNVVFLEFCGNVGSAVRDKATEYLSRGNLSKFKLKNPAVTIDVSAVKVICLCDEANARMLAKFCEVVNVKELDNDEYKTAVFDMAYAYAKRPLKRADVRFSEDVFEDGCRYSPEDIADAIDEITWMTRQSDSPVTVTREVVERVVTTRKKSNSVNKFGFGGKINENF